MKKEPIMQQPHTIEPSLDDSLSLEAILEEARELRRQKTFAEEEPLSETGAEGKEAVQEEKEEETESNEPEAAEKTEEKISSDVSFQQEKGAPSHPFPEEKAKDGGMEARGGFFSSIRGFFLGRAKDEDVDPDDMMKKYGTISLGSAQKEGDKGPQADSFFFTENIRDEGEPEELSNEFSTIFEKIQQGRRLDREKKEEEKEDTPSELEDAAAVQEDSLLEPEDRAESFDEGTQAEKSTEPSETAPQQEPEEEEDSPEEQAEGSRPAEEIPDQPEAAGQKELTEEDREAAQSLEVADRLISQDYVTGDISLEEVIANAEKRMQERIVPFEKKAEDGPETEALLQKKAEKVEIGRQSEAETKNPEKEKSAPADTMEWDIFQAVSNRYEQSPQKPKPAHRAPVPGRSGGHREKQDAVRPYRSETQEQPAAHGEQSKKTEQEESNLSRSKKDAGRSNSTRKFDVVKGGQAPQATLHSPKKKKKRKPANKNIFSQPQRQKEHFRLFGDVEPEGPPLEEPKTDELEYIDDYTEPGDAFSVRAEIVGNVRRLLLRTAATAVLTILGVALAVTQRLEAENPASFFAEHVYLYPIFNLLLLLLAAGCCYVPIGNGLASLVKLRGNSDSSVAFAVLAAALQSILAFIAPQPYITGALSLYTPLVVLALFLNSAGKFAMVRRIQQNFKFVSSPDQKQAVKIVTDSKQSEKMCKGMGLEAPLIAYSRKSGFLTDFLRLSYEPDPSEKLAGKLAPFGVLFSIAVGIGIFAAARDIQQAVTSLAIAACLCVPFCCELALNRPLRELCRRLNRQSAMLVGYPGVLQLADVNVVQVDASELYPRGSVVLHGIKTFSGQRIDESILQAAAIMCMLGGPLAFTFDQIIKGKGDILPQVEALDYEDEMGVVAWVGGVRVLLGNRRLLEEHGIAPPSLDYEKKYLTGGRQATYLASGGDLVAMFVVSYHPDAAVMEELQRLEDNGVSLLVRTYDSNITAKMISDHYKLAFRSVKVLPYAESRIFETLKEEEEERTRAYVATRGKASVMHRVIAACVRFKGNSSLSLILQVTGVAFSVLLIGLLAVFGGLVQIGTLEMLLYVVFWSAAVLIVPSLRKP